MISMLTVCSLSSYLSVYEQRDQVKCERHPPTSTTTAVIGARGLRCRWEVTNRFSFSPKCAACTLPSSKMAAPGFRLNLKRPEESFALQW